MDFDTLYPARFLKAGEFGGRDVTYTIKAVQLEELGEDSQKKAKAVVTFGDAPKQWVMNRTNGTCLKAMFGRETDAWVGKRVTLFPANITDPFTGEDTIAIRVRGSPDIAEGFAFQAKIGRKTVNMRVQKTGGANGPKIVPVQGMSEARLNAWLKKLDTMLAKLAPNDPNRPGAEAQRAAVAAELALLASGGVVPDDELAPPPVVEEVGANG